MIIQAHLYFPVQRQDTYLGMFWHPKCSADICIEKVKAKDIKSYIVSHLLNKQAIRNDFLKFKHIYFKLKYAVSENLRNFHHTAEISEICPIKTKVGLPFMQIKFQTQARI